LSWKSGHGVNGVKTAGQNLDHSLMFFPAALMYMACFMRLQKNLSFYRLRAKQRSGLFYTTPLYSYKGIVISTRLTFKRWHVKNKNKEITGSSYP